MGGFSLGLNDEEFDVEGTAVAQTWNHEHDSASVEQEYDEEHNDVQHYDDETTLPPAPVENITAPPAVPAEDDLDENHMFG